MLAVKECKSASDVLAAANANYAFRRAIFARRPEPVEKAKPVVEEIAEPPIWIGGFDAHVRRYRDFHAYVISSAVKEAGERMAAERQARDRILEDYKIRTVVDPRAARQTMQCRFSALCDRFGYGPAEINGPRKTDGLARARQKIIWVIAAEYPEKSLLELGRFFGGRDHTTILHSINKIKSLLERGDPSVSDLEAIVRGDA